MNKLHEFFTSIYKFLAAQDIETISREAGKFSLATAAKSPYTWLIGAPILSYLLWTKKFKAIIAIVSFFLFVLLLQHTVLDTKGTISLDDMLRFIGGATALIGINLYLLFIRQ